MHIVFICNGNVARSQEAELFFNTLNTNPTHSASSGGVNVKLEKPINPDVVHVMGEIGYNMSSAKRKFADETMVHRADMIISFKPRNELPAFARQHPNIRFWKVTDPQDQSLDFHRAVRDEVKRQVEGLVEEIATQA